VIGIKSIASYIPDDFVDNYTQAKLFDETDDFIKNKIGAERLPRKKPEQETSDLVEMAVLNLLKKCPELDKSKIDALIVVTQNPDEEGLPHTAAIAQRKLNLPTSVAAFDVSLGCSGYVYGLSIIKGFLETSGLKNGILVTCDPYSKIINMDDRITSMLFGDAATATWMGDNPYWRLDSISYGTDGSGSEYLKLVNQKLLMNGRQIFNFAATQVEPNITEILKRAGLQPEDVDLYCLHQGSAAIIDAISRRFPSVSERFVKKMTNTGNTVSSSIPILLEEELFNKNINRILICGFGVGLSIATAIITEVGKE